MMNQPLQRMRGVLRHLVSLKRPYGSPQEGSIPVYLSRMFTEYAQWIDGAGNLHVDTREDASNRTLFVAHTDTVHGKGGPNRFLENAQGLYAEGAPLGADDAAGVSILAAMIGVVPAYYIFTRGEECGGIGSTYLADYHKDLLRQFDRAIAFDRRGTGDVITHQAGGNCASELFAWALSDRLNSHGLMYVPCDGGVYTDTAEFVRLIPECTNISCGYEFEHTAKEWLDIKHHETLCRAALEIQWDTLPTARPVTSKVSKGAAPWWDAEPANMDGVLGSDWPTATNETEQAIEGAIWEAMSGRLKDLLDLIAEHVNPNDPQKARCQIDPHYLQTDHIEDACVDSADWEMVLETLADNAYIPL